MYPFDIAQLRSLTPSRVLNIFKIAGAYVLSRVTGRLFLAGYPAVLSIEPTSLCNLKCPQCPTGLGALNRPQGYMDFDLYKSIIDASARHVTNIQFYFQGEPFMHKELAKMIRYAKDRNIYCLTSTNGHFLTCKTIIDVLDSGLDALVLGLDGVDEATYLNYRKNGRFDKVVEGAAGLIEERAKRNLAYPKVYLQFIVMKDNENQIEAVKEFGRSIGVDKVLIKSVQVYPEMDPEMFLPENDKYSRYELVNGELTLNVPIPNHCSKIFSTGVFTWDGKMAACCFDKDAANNFGNWNGAGMNEIWRSKRGMEFRRKIFRERSQIKMCSNCTEGIKVFR